MPTPAPIYLDVPLHPLTAKERAVWLLHEFLPDKGVLNFSFVVEPVAELDLAALRAAVAALIWRHENLRMLFPTVEGEPRRLMLSADDPRLERVVQVREVLAAKLDDEFSRELSAGFELSAEPPIRVLVLRCGGLDRICVTVSHIAYDAFSQLTLRAEIKEAYAALRSGGRLPPSLASQVPAPALRDPGKETLAYWREVLADAHPSRDLDIGRSRDRDPDYPGVTLRQRIRPETWNAVSAVARGTSCPVTAVLLAGFATLLSRHGAGNDLVIGVPHYNRGFPPHQAIGYYACIAAVRVQLDEYMDFYALVRQCGRQLLEGLQHPGASLDDVRPGAFEASVSGTRPLVRYNLNYLADLPTPPDLGKVLRDCPPPRRTLSRMNLDLAVQNEAEGPEFRAIHASDVFSIEEMDRMLGRLQIILAAARSGGNVGSIEMRTEADLAPGASTRLSEPPQPPLLAEEIATSVFANPGSAAFVPAAESGLRYTELDASAGALAAKLVDRGIITGQRIGVLADSLVETVIGVLGCWAAGGAPVLAADASNGLDLCVTATTAPKAPGDVPIRRVTGSSTGVIYLLSPDDPALIVPNGATSVVLSHGALAGAAAALAAELLLTSGDLVAVGPSARCGPEFLEVLLALAAGARVLPMAAADGTAARHAFDQGATVLVVSPEVADTLLAGLKVGGPPGRVRLLLRGGRLLPGMAARAREAGISLLRVTGPMGSVGIMLTGTLPDEAGSGLLGRVSARPQLRMADDSGAPALPLMWARLRDRDGTDVLGVLVREVADGWLETIDDGLDSDRDEVTCTGPQPLGIAEALGVDFIDLWRTILGRPEAGAEDSFFELGGDSMHAARLVAQVRQRTGVKMSLRAVFKAPTPVSFAAAVRAAR